MFVYVVIVTWMYYFPLVFFMVYIP